MATITLLKRLTSAKNKKKNPDWARVEEPDTILLPMFIGILGLIITGFSVLLAWTVMTISPTYAIANFLVSLNSDLPFERLYASFGSALIVMINLMVVTIFVVFHTANNDDIVEMISDLDANFQERIVELENSTDEKLNRLIVSQDERDTEFKQLLLENVTAILQPDSNIQIAATKISEG